MPCCDAFSASNSAPMEPGTPSGSLPAEAPPAHPAAAANTGAAEGPVPAPPSPTGPMPQAASAASGGKADTQQAPDQRKSCSVFFCCAPLDITIEELQQVFHACGTVVDIHLYRSFPRCRVSKGCGVATFANPAGAAAAVETLDGTQPFERCNKPLAVRPAQVSHKAPAKPSGRNRGPGSRNNSAGASGLSTRPAAGRVSKPPGSSNNSSDNNNSSSSSDEGGLSELQALHWALLQANLRSSSSSSTQASSSWDMFACGAAGAGGAGGGWCGSEPLPPGLEMSNALAAAGAAVAAGMPPPGIMPGMDTSTAASLLLSAAAAGASSAATPMSGRASEEHSMCQGHHLNPLQLLQAAAAASTAAAAGGGGQAAGAWQPQDAANMLMWPGTGLTTGGLQQGVTQAHLEDGTAAAPEELLLLPAPHQSMATWAGAGLLEEPHHPHQQQQQQQQEAVAVPLPAAVADGSSQWHYHSWESAPSHLQRTGSPLLDTTPFFWEPCVQPREQALGQQEGTPSGGPLGELLAGRQCLTDGVDLLDAGVVSRHPQVLQNPCGGAGFMRRSLSLPHMQRALEQGMCLEPSPAAPSAAAAASCQHQQLLLLEQLATENELVPHVLDISSSSSSSSSAAAGGPMCSSQPFCGAPPGLQAASSPLPRVSSALQALLEAQGVSLPVTRSSSSGLAGTSNPSSCDGVSCGGLPASSGTSSSFRAWLNAHRGCAQKQEAAGNQCAVTEVLHGPSCATPQQLQLGGMPESSCEVGQAGFEFPVVQFPEAVWPFGWAGVGSDL